MKMAISSFTLRHDLIRHPVSLGKKSLINLDALFTLQLLGVEVWLLLTSELTNQGARKALVTRVVYSANVHSSFSNNKLYTQRK